MPSLCDSVHTDNSMAQQQEVFQLRWCPGLLVHTRLISGGNWLAGKRKTVRKGRRRYNLTECVIIHSRLTTEQAVWLFEAHALTGGAGGGGTRRCRAAIFHWKGKTFFSEDQGNDVLHNYVNHGCVGDAIRQCRIAANRLNVRNDSAATPVSSGPPSPPPAPSPSPLPGSAQEYTTVTLQCLADEATVRS